MPINHKQRRLKIALMFFSAVLFANLLIAPQVKAVLPVGVTADATATAIATKDWLTTAWEYIRNKVATILFQNLLRKYINDLAMDAAKYLAIGAKGQEQLYIEKKWGEHWNDIADQALGDFIETFANSVVSDVAAGQIKKEGLAICDQQKQECVDRGGADCDTPYQECLKNKDDMVALTACDTSFSDCQKNCDTAKESTRAQCQQACTKTRDACKQTAKGSTEAARVAPMFDSANSPLAKVNICNPSLEVSLTISLGLTQSYTGFQTNCSFSTMVKNWKSEFERQTSMSSADFLQKMESNFHPTGSDLGAAFLLNSNIIEYRNIKTDYDKAQTIANKGWLDVRNFAGGLTGTPEAAADRKKLADQAVWDNLGKITGDILVDAANIFLNQWAISSFTNLMGNLSSEGSRGSLSYWSSQQTTRQAIENRLSKLSEPLFASDGNINILAQLTTCPDPGKPGPTDCVIGNEFSTAIENKMTVAEAVRSGQLPGNWPFGFDKNGEDKLVYNQGYPYRSMIILRKYRILPVGWEVAAQEIQRKYLTNNFADKADGVTLNDMLSCYSPNDGLTGYYADWCRGLVDPNWVLKVPDYFCARKGFGPELITDPTLMGTGVKFCSADNGETRTIVEDKLAPCEINDDCCTEAELGARQKLIDAGKDQDARKYTCGATCSYNEQKLLVNRNDRYCADEQGCIKEGRNGSCLSYGYCTEEKRSWVFNKEKKDESCEPLFNTCQAFKAPDGKNVSYLANTLDYGCQQSAIGCKEYSYNGTYNAGDNTVNWDRNQSIYLNRKTGTCDAKQEGCHEFIRVKDENGANLLADGGLEASDNDRWSRSGGLVDGTGSNHVYQGGVSLKVGVGKRGVYFGPSDQSLMPAGFVFDLDRLYTLSAYVFVTSGKVEMVMGNSADPTSVQVINSTATGEWQNMVLTLLNDGATRANFFAIRGTTPNTEFFVDNMKFEMGTTGKYSSYRADNLLYEKLLPNYLEESCYRDKTKDFNFKDDAPAKCSEFARKCQADEVGCELYTEVNTKDQTAAQVKPKNYCPKECVGYDTFIQQANNFYSSRDEYFIPKTAKTCRASSVGCSMFVNLDKVNAGGEDNVYFANFRRCVKPDDAASHCAEFYTWEGSDESGYQLVVYQLQANQDTTSGISQPATIDDTDTKDNNDGPTCNEDIYALPYDHPQYNPDCRQFYGRDGNVSYHIMAKTIACSKTCFPYRLVNSNVDVSVTDQTACNAKQGHWDTDKQNCVVCINGGVWTDEQQGCVYQADPGKSQTCSASEVGCSEYEGDFGNQVRIMFYDTFESGSSNWIQAGGQAAETVSDSLTVGGHSLKTTSNSIEKTVPGKLKPGKRYTLSFTAKKKSNNVSISSINLETNISSTAGIAISNLTFVNNLEISPDWTKYTFDVVIFGDQEINSSKVKFNFNGTSADLRLDNIKLLEMTDTYFLIRNSWTTPDTCNQDLFGNPAPLYMLGCKQYSDRDNKPFYLKDFYKLCQDSAVGCELMIDTHNSSSYAEQTFNTVKVPADNFAYIVYEKSKECRFADKGCSRLGQYDDLAEAHKDVYMLSDPDRFKDTMCTKDQVGCEAWGLDGGGEAYFKDPGLRTCEYRQGDSGFGWFKIKASRCVGTKTCTGVGDTTTCGAGKYCAEVSSGSFACASKFSCASDGDCSVGLKCQMINTDESCGNQTSYNKTIGLGVRDGKVQPIGMAEKNSQGNIGNAGLCPANQTGCTEYIDPESSFSYDLLAKCLSNQRLCSVKVKPDTLYVLKTSDTTEVTITCAGHNVYHLAQNNTIPAPADNVKTVKQSEEFYVDGGGGSGEIECTVDPARTADPTKNAQLRLAIVSYRLKDTLNQDKPTTVNPGKGQVLFNERSFNGGKYNPLVWDVNISGVVDGVEQKPQPAQNGNENNANALLKVDPDRQCATWLGCKSYMENPAKPGDKICYERGLCDQMNDAGECISFISPAPPVTAPVPPNVQGAPLNQTWNTTVTDISNMTGYSKVGYLGNALNADMYNLANMKQEGDAKVKFDGSFENAWETDFLDFKTGTTRASIVSDAKIIEKELGFGSYKVIPDGRAVGKTNTFVVKEVNNAGNRAYVISAYVFLRYGSKVELTVGRNMKDSVFTKPPTGACPFESVNDISTGNVCNVTESNNTAAVVASTDVLGRWVRLVGKFSIGNNYQRSLPGGGNERDTRITIGIKPTDGLVYFDDVRIEPALNYKDGGAPTTKQYLHSDCRLYPDRDSMSCDYYDDSGLRKKGWAGYCLEYDPRNPAVCLLWYPIDKIESEEYEEGVGLNFAKDFYYCVDSTDGCNVAEPEFFCNKFIKVDKESYWYDRIAPGNTGYFIPYNLLTNVGIDPETRVAATSSYFYANFGVNAGGKTKDIILNQKAGSGYYGAYSSLKPPREDKLSIGNVSGKIMSFVPYYGWSQAGAGNKSLYCKATLDSNGKDLPWELSMPYDSTGCQDWRQTTFKTSNGDTPSYDDCFIRIITEYDNTGSQDGLNQVCASWDYLGDSGAGWCTALNGDKNYVKNWFNCKKGAFPCTTLTTLGPEPHCNPLSPCGPHDGTKCQTGKNSDNSWYGRVSDTCDNNDNPGCFFDCFNHTNFYRLAFDVNSSMSRDQNLGSRKRAVEAVKRLFVGESKDNDSCYVWQPDTKTYRQSSNPSECDLGVDFNINNKYCIDLTGKNIRPDYNPANNNDYCIVYPTVPAVKLNDYLLKGNNYLVNAASGGGWVTISFASQVEKQQLPLRKYVINWGYSINNIPLTSVSIVDMNSRPSVKNGHTAFRFLDYQEIRNNNPSLCGDCSPEVRLQDPAAKNCCTITPRVSLTDNWDAVSVSAVNNDTALGPINNPSLDHPIIIYTY